MVSNFARYDLLSPLYISFLRASSSSFLPTSKELSMGKSTALWVSSVSLNPWVLWVFFNKVLGLWCFFYHRFFLIITVWAIWFCFEKLWGLWSFFDQFLYFFYYRILFLIIIVWVIWFCCEFCFDKLFTTELSVAISSCMLYRAVYQRIISWFSRFLCFIPHLHGSIVVCK